MIPNIIFAIHVALFIIGVVLPFVANRQLLIAYTILVPFLFFHWAVNDDTCALTQLEMAFTDTPKEQTFMGRLVGPIYKMPDDEASKLAKGLFFTLWFVAQWRLGPIIELLKSK